MTEQALDLTGYTLTFDDEFNAFSWHGGGKQGTWNTTYAYGERKLNDELQYYADPFQDIDPFSLRDGALVITATPSADPARTWGQPYVSGVITSLGSFSQQYGYFEMRAKLPAGQGLWPAFWMLPVEHVWPPELDILEAFGSEPNQLHWAALTATSLGNAGDWVGLPADTTRGYHRYGARWTAQTLTYYFDGEPVAQAATPADMNQPMYLIANLAVGGHWPGDPFPNTPLPAQLAIDYIRAYSDAPSAVAAPSDAVSTPDTHIVEAAAAPPAGPPRRTAAATNWVDSAGTRGTPAGDQFQTYYGDTATRTGGPGDDTYIVTDPRQYIAETTGEGVDLVRSWIGYTLPPDVENIEIAAGWGLRATGNSASNYVAGNTGDDTLSGGAGGDDVLSGHGGRNTFVVIAGGGHDTVTDFQAGAGPAHDVVQLDGFSFQSAAQALAALQQAGADVVLPFHNGETLTFWDASASAFSPGNFQLSNVAGPPASGAAVPSPVASFAANTLVLHLSEDAFAGDAQVTVTIDDRQLGGVHTVTASHADGQPQAFTFTGRFGAGPHTVTVRFLNDAWGGAGHDRNAYVDAVSYDGRHTALNIALETAGSAAFEVSPLLNAVTPDIPVITGLSLARGAVAISGTAAAACVIVLFDGAARVGTALSDGVGAWSITPDVAFANGAHRLAAQATDAAGNQSLAPASSGFVAVAASNDGVVTLPNTGFRTSELLARTEGALLLAHDGQTDVIVGATDLRFIDGRLVHNPDDAAAQVARLYHAALGREPDQGGLSYWTTRLQTSDTQPNLASAFVASKEFAAAYDALGDSDFITRLYGNVLGRLPDVGGLASWLDSLRAGSTRGGVVAGLSESVEHRARTAGQLSAGLWDRDEAAAQIARLYDTVFGRLPDIGGLGFWKAALASGASTLGVVDSLTGAAEFRAAYGSLDSHEFVRTLYQNTLHRAGDAAGLDHWTKAIEDGTLGKSAVVLAFSDSAEHRANTATTFGGEARSAWGIQFAG